MKIRLIKNLQIVGFITLLAGEIYQAESIREKYAMIRVNKCTLKVPREFFEEIKRGRKKKNEEEEQDAIMRLSAENEALKTDKANLERTIEEINEALAANGISIDCDGNVKVEAVLHTYSDSTFKSWTKEELIRHIRMLEANNGAAHQQLDQQAKNFVELEKQLEKQVEKKTAQVLYNALKRSKFREVGIGGVCMNEYIYWDKAKEFFKEHGVEVE